MFSDSDETEKPSMVMKLVLPVVAGCLLTCCLSVIINYFQYSNKLVKLDKDLDDYNVDECIPPYEAEKTTMIQTLIWSIMPATINLLVWGGIIWFITRPVKNLDNNESE
jgi:hypothetical protein